MNIAFLHHVFQSGSGIEQVIYELAKAIQSQGHNTVIVTYDNQCSQDSVQVMEFKVPTLAMGGIMSPLFFQTNEYIRETLGWADVVVTSLYPMSIVPLWPHRARPKVVFIDWGVQPYWTFNSPLDKAYLWLLNRMDSYAVKKSDMVMVANNVTKRWVEKRGVKPVKMMLYGINFDRLNLDANYRHLELRHGITNEDNVLLYAGRQSPHKNIELLVDTVAWLKFTGYRVKLLLVGSPTFPKYANRLKKMVGDRNLGNDIIFTGLVSEDNLAGYYNMCDIFVNASRWEGFLNPEAFAFKKPIVAYGIAPHGETVRHGMNGLLTKSLTVEDFASCIATLLDDPARRTKMGEEGYRWVTRELDYKVVAGRFVNTIEKVL